MLGLVAATPADAATTASTHASLSADSDSASDFTLVNYNSGDCLGILGGADDTANDRRKCTTPRTRRANHRGRHPMQVDGT